MKWQCLPQEQIFALMDSFSIIEAAALIAGHPPSNYRLDDYNGNEYYYLDNATDQEKTTFDLAKNSLRHAIEMGNLKACIKAIPTQTLYKQDITENWQIIGKIDDWLTRIKRDDLVSWLAGRGCYPEFFFPEKLEKDYLNQIHPHYTPKLAAVIAAWEATSEAVEMGNIDGKTVKQFATEWFKNNAENYGVKNDSNTKTAFEEMATIMNWETTGRRTSTKITLALSGLDAQQVALIKKSTIDPRLKLKKEDLTLKPTHQNLEDDLPF